MAKLSAEKIELIQKLYAQYGVYSRVAKEVGCAASTVKKYVDGAVKTDGARLRLKWRSSKVSHFLLNKFTIR